MNEQEAGRILAVAIQLDPKFPQPDDAGLLRKVWARTLHDVPYDVADRAVTAYYRSDEYLQHREPLAPANIVQYWNARRRPTEAERTGLNAATRRALPAPERDPISIQAGVDHVRAVLLGRKPPQGDGVSATDGSSETAASAIREVRSRPCGHCGAEIGRPCIDGRGNPLTKSLAHPSRLKDADVPPRGSADEALTEVAAAEASS